MKDALESLEKNNVTQKLEDNNASLKYVQKAIDDFEIAISNFLAQMKNVKESNNPMKQRILNDQMMHLERVFLLPKGNNH